MATPQASDSLDVYERCIDRLEERALALQLARQVMQNDQAWHNIQLTQDIGNIGDMRGDILLLKQIESGAPIPFAGRDMYDNCFNFDPDWSIAGWLERMGGVRGESVGLETLAHRSVEDIFETHRALRQRTPAGMKQQMRESMANVNFRLTDWESDSIKNTT